jgi:PAS domain S-box-containing protein
MIIRGKPVVLEDAIVAFNEISKDFDRAEIGVSEEAAEEFFTTLDRLIVRAQTCLPERRRVDGDPNGHLEYERQIERSLRMTQHCVDSAPIGIFRIDSDGNIQMVNEAACRALDYSADELKRLSIFDIDPSMDREKWFTHRTEVRQSGARTLISSHRRRDGTVFPVEVSVRQLLINGELFSISFVKDISERVFAEQERRRLEERMLQAQKLESLGVLAGGIAHDFNNILTIILGNLEISLGDVEGNTSTRTSLDEALRATHQAAELCRQLLIYAGKGESKPKLVDLCSLLQEQAQMLEVSATKAIRLSLKLEKGVPYILADTSQLRQIFMNLIINAADAIGSAPGVITVTTHVADFTREELDVQQLSASVAPGPYVIAEVTDNGIGMSEQVRNKIFDPFFSTKTMGRGLGLAAVRGIVHNHGGAISVISEIGRGTTFKLLFPVPKTSEKVVSSVPNAPMPLQGDGTVLLVDDEPALRSLGERILTRFGFEVVIAKNGRDALSAFNEYREKISIVVLDWTMPEMGGGETFERLREMSPHLPIIIASGHAAEDGFQRFSEMSSTVFVRKPYQIDDLKRAIALVTPS